MCALKTPILFLVSNRPVDTARVFAAIRIQQPSRLFIACDGAEPEQIGNVKTPQVGQQNAQARQNDGGPVSSHGVIMLLLG